MKKKKFKMPHVFVIMLILMIVVTILTYIIPSGSYDRVEVEGSTTTAIVEGSFKYIDNEDPIGIMDFFRTIYNGFVASASIIGSLLICSGALGILNSTNTLTSGIQKLISVSKGKELISLIVFYTFFAILNTKGSGEGSYAFYPVVISLVLTMGYDRIVGAGTIMFGCTAGFASGIINIFTTGISQQMVGLPMFSGFGYRIVVFAVLYLIGLFFIFGYAKKIKKDPTKSYVAEEYQKQLADAENAETSGKDDIPFNTQRKIGLIVFVALLCCQVVGALKFSWGLAEISSAYVMYSIFLAFLFKINPTEYSQTFVKGASGVLGAALVIGLARSIMLLLTQGQVMDTFVNAMSTALDGKSSFIALLLILLFVTLFNFLVTSGSGKAVMMMPIMSPLGKLLGINQQVMVLTYQLGDGLTNMLWPGGGAVGCSLCGLDYGVWIKYSWKVFVTMIGAAYILIVIANAINYGPF